MVDLDLSTFGNLIFFLNVFLCEFKDGGLRQNGQKGL